MARFTNYNPTMTRFRRPCLDCGVLSQGNRCAEHQAKIDRARERARDTPERRAKKRNYYDNNYRKQAKHIRQTALTCHLCGQGAKPNDPWSADHLIPGDKTSPLLPAHRSCNARRGDKPLLPLPEHTGGE